MTRTVHTTGARGDDQAGVPPRRPPARRRVDLRRVDAALRQHPGDDGVRVPHLAGVGLVAAPHGRGDRRHGVEDPSSHLDVVGHAHRTPDRLTDIGDASVAPAPDLVAEEPNPSRPAGSHRAAGDDTTRCAVAVGNGRLLDDVRTFRDAHLQRRMEEVAPRAPLHERGDGFEQLAADPHDVCVGSQRDPVEVNGSRWCTHVALTVVPPDDAAGLLRGSRHRGNERSPTLTGVPGAFAVRELLEIPGSSAVVAHLLWEQEVGGSNPPSPTPARTGGDTRGCSSMAEPQTSNLMTGVRFSSPAPNDHRSGVAVAESTADPAAGPDEVLLAPPSSEEVHAHRGRGRGRASRRRAGSRSSSAPCCGAHVEAMTGVALDVEAEIEPIGPEAFGEATALPGRGVPHAHGAGDAARRDAARADPARGLGPRRGVRRRGSASATT